jgi:transketolase
MNADKTSFNSRRLFADLLYEEMKKDERIWLITADLGFMMYNEIRKDFPGRIINVGAAEQLMLGVGVGLALQGKRPFCYSITPFLLYRPLEWIRNYLAHERVEVKLVGSGLEDDYKHDGFSHHCFEYGSVLRGLDIPFHLSSKDEEVFRTGFRFFVDLSGPAFLGLHR